MADLAVQPPYLDPSQYPAYLDLQKKQMIASALMGAFQQTNQTPADWDSMRVVPRRSILQNVASLATALGAGKAQRGAFDAQQNYLKGLFAPQTSSAAPQAPSDQPATSQPPPLLARPDQPATSTAATPQQDPDAMLLIPGDRARSQMFLQMMGQQEYAKALATRMSPTDLQKTLSAAGVPIEQQRAALLANVQKQNYIAPVGGARPGTVAFNPLNGQPLFAQPDVGRNVNLTPDAQGNVSVSPIPGNAAAQSALTAADTAAKVTNTPQTFPTAGGGSTVGYPGDVLGAPPAQRNGAQAPRVATPSFAPSTTSAPSQPLQGAWASMPKLAVSRAIGAPDAFTEGRLKAAGEKDATLSSQLGNEAALADQQLEYSREARGALQTADTGPLSEWLTRHRSALIELGVPEGLIPQSGSVVPTLELNKALKNAALQGARTIYGPRMTQTEVKLQTEEMSPSASMMSDAIASLMKQNDVRSLYAKQRAEDYGKYVQNGGDPLRFESWYSTKFPLATFARAAQASPQEIAAEMKRRGLQ